MIRAPSRSYLDKHYSMKPEEFIGESEDALFEMSNFGPKTTGLPNGIELWTRTDPLRHGHNRYRVKITKDQQWAAIYLVSQEPRMKKNINQSLTTSDDREIKTFIKTYSSLLIGLIDNKFDTAEFIETLKKLRG